MPPTASHIEHLILTQLFRWFQLDEVPVNAARLANQTAVLADDIVIRSDDQTVRGKLAYLQDLQQRGSGQNAHLVLTHAVQAPSPGRFHLTADIVNQHLQPDGGLRNRAVHYEAVLVNSDDELPVFQTLHVSHICDLDTPRFRTSYADNRAQSFLYRWLYLMATWRADATQDFQELLASQFTIVTTSSPAASDRPPGSVLTTWDQLAAWLSGLSATVRQRTYRVRHTSVHANADSTLTLEATIRWRLERDNGDSCLGDTRYVWVLESHPDERFARLRSLRIDNEPAAPGN